MNPTPDELLHVIQFLGVVLLIAAFAGLARMPDEHAQCEHLHQKLAHAELVHKATRNHAQHTALPNRHCERCERVEPE